MNIEARKISLIQQLLLVQQESILDKIETLLFKKTSDLTNEQKKAIDKGIQSIDDENVVSHKEAIQQMKEKYPKYF